MEYVKKKHTDEAHTLLDGFLQRSRSLHGGLYVEDLYDNMSADFCGKGVKTKGRLISLLCDDQDNRCCYCMRNLSALPKGETTIEHVIVNHTKDDYEYGSYLGLGSSIDVAPITSTKNFLEKQVPPPPYPHSIAYENLLVSCLGHLHIGIRKPVSCNNKREHKFVTPLPLRKNISKEITYKKTGEMLWSKETDAKNPSIEVLGLNDEFLKIIRRLWYKLSIKHQTPATCNKSKIVYEVLGDMLDEGLSDAYAQKLFLFYNNSWYWGLLSQFDYFNDPGRFK